MRQVTRQGCKRRARQQRGRQQGRALLSFALAVAVLAPVAAGCSALTGGRTQIDSASGLFDKAKITYRSDFPGLQAPPAAASGAQLASYTPASQADAARNCRGTLEIVYPHPDGRPGLALARVVIGAEPAQKKPSGWRRVIPWPQPRDESGQETYSIDIPRGELDHIVGKLQQTGYFEKSSSSQRASDLTAQIDGGAVRRSWDRVPELDALLAHVCASGRSALASQTQDWASSMASDQSASPAPIPFAGLPAPDARLR